MNFLKRIVNSFMNFVAESAHEDLISAIGTPETASTPEEAFLVEALVTTMRGIGTPLEIMKNQANFQAVHPLLHTNIDKLNDHFLEWLPTWFNTKLTTASTSQARRISGAITAFSTVLQDFPYGNRACNIEIAITGYKLGEQIKRREEFPGPWAEDQHNLAAAYANRIRGQRVENLEQAITCCENALQVRTRESRPRQWATTQLSLGSIYRNRILGDSEENLERAIVCYEGALQIITLERYPKDWAKALHNLAIAYFSGLEKMRLKI